MSPRGLRLASDLTLPVDAVSQTFAIVGKRGVGKTTTAAVLTEELLRAHLPVVILDPLDGWYGLRASADGKAEGFPITVFGGQHGDAPLEAAAGELLADLVVDERISAVLSLRHLRKGEQQRFVTDFAERLYHRKGEDRHREALHLVIDEADLYAPQRVFAGQERMLGAVDDLVRRGRSSGIGVTVITQRPASIAKDVLTQLEVLICHRLVSPQDRKAVEAWIEAHDVYDQRKDFMASLASLPVGTAWVWSPGWLELFQRVKIRARETFDSASTPKAGAKPVEPKRLAPVDLARLRARMAETLERTKANDPRELRRQVADLKAQLAKAAAGAGNPSTGRIRRVEIPVLTPTHLTRIEAAVRKLDGGLERLFGFKTGLQDLANGIREAVTPILQELRTLRVGAPPGPSRADLVRAQQHGATAAEILRRPTAVMVSRATEPTEGVSASQQRILDALAWLETIGLSPASKTQVALLADQSPTSGGYFNNLGRLRSNGLIAYPAPSTVAVTETGRARARLGAIPTTPEGLQAQLFARLSSSQAAILRSLIAAYPQDLAKTDLAGKSGQSPTSGGYFNNLGRLRSLGLINYPSPGRVVAMPVLFLEGRG